MASAHAAVGALHKQHRMRPDDTEAIIVRIADGGNNRDSKRKREEGA
eukprot:CAMPEP_0206168310 /NCGR_PEP_ID=MMETSP1474-20131121/31560_1 /ASSEMBLY_ACC=CAM_ASM_001110 /TAXON_ID=97495 /ORGANISM="Imantonia sp., Strain RCC918" /LENGTH=46 /DNA_ID= /DNA_START= /DNA_END= /DNA_ORIENTATION=